MLESVVNAVAERLAAAGIDVRRRYIGEKLDRHAPPRVFVGVKSGENSDAGFGSYLGMRNDAEYGELSVFGFRLDTVIALSIYASEDGGAEACEAVYSAVAMAARSFPQGLAVRGLKCSAAAPDLKTGMFLCEAELSLTAYFEAAADDETGEFIDFELIGEMKNAV